ncbi:MAG: protein BatD [gamma proteobacterium endosymbiont of Lamellibrachia anaximandri]|nr:protein BatD [gamma proteobacterium endosymbiont of Lamellibrachia anaximandri]MBL3618292.1 protein BatD [gamma proteobacterium endosymbiont of Lamellibrachia anaximandri]
MNAVIRLSCESSTNTFEIMMQFPFFLRYPLYRCAILILLLAGCSNAFGEVTARLSRSTISADETVSLTIQIKGENEAKPDLSVLDAQFEILGRSQQQSISVINGNVSRSRGLNLTLLPKTTGTLEIPPIPVGKKATASLRLQVSEGTGESNGLPGSDVFIELELSETSAYLQQEIVLTLRLFMGEGVRGEQLSDPKPNLPDTVIQRISETQYKTQRAGENYQVVERRYAVFAYQSGQLKLDGVRFSGRGGGRGGSIYDLLNSPFGNQKVDRQIYRAVSDAVNIDIKPIPANFNARHWLPARNLQLVETGLAQNNQQIAGKPLTRTIMLFADGLTSAQLPAIDMNLPEGVKQYPDRPEMKDNLSGAGITGSRQNKVTLVAANPGDYELPAIEIPWWNTETDRMETARLPARNIEVLGGTASIPRPLPKRTGSSATAGETAPEAANLPATPESTDNQLTHWLIWVLALGWITTLVVWRMSRHRSKQQTAAPAAIDPAEAVRRQSIEQAIETLEGAYHEQDRDAARDAWLRWGELRWPEKAPSNLNRLSHRCPKRVAEAILALDLTFYSQDERSDWVKFDPGVLRKKSVLSTNMIRERQTALTPLNP